MSRTNYSTYMIIKRQILQICESENFPGNKLPPETALAERLGISLVTLREAMLMLALEGYITKRHGSGNYIHPSALNFENRTFYFAEGIANEGYQPSVKLVGQDWTAADERCAAHLGLKVGHKLLHNRNYYCADDKVAIVCDSYLPAELLRREDIAYMDFSKLHLMLGEYCYKDVAHSNNEYMPMALTEELSEIMGLPVGTPIIYNEQVFYDVADQPLLYNVNYFYPDIYRIKILKNWDLGH